MLRISDHQDYLFAKNLEDRVIDRCTRDSTGLEIEEDPEKNASYEEACESFREDQQSHRFETERYQLASGDR